MKRIREINGKKVLLLEIEDVETLLESRCCIPAQIFTEPSIAKMKCNDEGLYEIVDPNHIEYIASLGFIPDYDYLASLSKEELDNLADKAVADKAKVSAIITRLCEYKKRLKGHEKKVLKQANFIDPICRERIEDNVLNAGLERINFRFIESALIAQARNYTNAIVKMADSPKLGEKPKTK